MKIRIVTILLGLILVVSSCGKPEKEVKLLRSIDSIDLKAHAKGWFVTGWVLTARYHLNKMYQATDSISKKHYGDTLNIMISKIDSLFADSTLNPIFKK